jgi:hypothetical protein
MSNDEASFSPAEKKAARDATRKILRQRKQEITEVLRADWDDRDPDTSNVLEAALDADGDGHMTSWLLFGLASRAISDLAAVTDESREECLARLMR